MPSFSFWLCAFGSRLLELAQQVLLLARQAGRCLHDDGDILVAAAAPIDIRDALALQTERRAGLRALADRIADLAVERRHLDLRSAGCLRERDGHLAVDVLPLPREQRVAADADRDHQIAARAAVESGVALAAHAQRLAVVDTGGELHHQLVAAAHLALALAAAARGKHRATRFADSSNRVGCVTAHASPNTGIQSQ